jgi:hypothetical protein
VDSRFYSVWYVLGCLKEFSIYLLVGGSLVGQGGLRFGRWCLSAFFGEFGKKEIVGVSKIRRILWRIF